MVTQGPASDPQHKLNISSFLTLPKLLDCIICIRNSIYVHCIFIINDDGMRSLSLSD